MIIKNYVKPIYPSGNIKVSYKWHDLGGVLFSDRVEYHYMLDGDKYIYYIQKPITGHVNGNYIHYYFYYEDNGVNSPVFIKKLIGWKEITDPNLRDQYGAYEWAVGYYVDSIDEFIESIRNLKLGRDNGSHASSLFMLYDTFAEIFNRGGCIPADCILTGSFEEYGYTKYIYETNDYIYQIDENYTCHSLRGKNYNRYMGWILDIEPITELPFELPNASNTTYMPIEIVGGNDFDQKDTQYFQIENLFDELNIYPNNNTHPHYYIDGLEVEVSKNNYVKIDELIRHSDGCYTFNDTCEDKTYNYLIQKYFNGIRPEVLRIRVIKSTYELPVHVKVINGRIRDALVTSREYGSEANFLSSEVLYVYDNYQYNSSTHELEKWIININGTITEKLPENFEITLPLSGEVLITGVIREIPPKTVKFTIIGEGTLSEQTREFKPGEYRVIATPSDGYEFSGWYVKGYMGPIYEERIHPKRLNDFDEYGRYSGNTPILVFDPYLYEIEEITAVFTKKKTTTSITTEKTYFDVVVASYYSGSYISKLNSDALQVTALRLYEGSYLCIEKLYKYQHIETYFEIRYYVDDVLKTERIDDYWSTYYFDTDSQIIILDVNPIN